MERCPARAIYPENGLYSIDPDLCIDCGICRETCPYTLPYHVGPVETRSHRQRLFFIDDQKCIGCSLCARKCPVGAISGERRQAYMVDQELCIGCGICQATCKKDAIIFEGDPIPEQYYSIDPDACIRCNQCKANCPAEAIVGELVPMHVVDYYNEYKAPYEIMPEKCLKCGICVTWCPCDAIAPASSELIEKRHAIAKELRAKVPVLGTEHALGV